MLSRSAEGLYWMGRYLERTEHLCRLLRLQTSALVDRPAQEIHHGWRRIYASMNRYPPVGDLEYTGTEEFTLADSYTLTDDLTFERYNPDSVWGCLAQGRENARQMRHCISGEMWTHLNLSYLRMQPLTILDIWADRPELFYAKMAADMDTFVGVATATMYRDEGWHFLQLGRFIEGAQLNCSLLLAQLNSPPAHGVDLDAQWMGLLKDYNAVEAYNRAYGVEIQAENVLELLATDPFLPRSLVRSLDRASWELNALDKAPNETANGLARRLAGRMRAIVHFDWPDRDDHREQLQRVSDYCRDLHFQVRAAYFDYPIEIAPAR